MRRYRNRKREGWEVVKGGGEGGRGRGGRGWGGKRGGRLTQI